jgi:hypothetical protein
MHTALRPLLAASIALSLAFWLFAPSPVRAGVNGPCSATLNGTDVAQNSGPIDVGSNDIVAVTMGSAAGEVTHLRVQMHYGPVSWNVHNEDTSGQSVSKSVSVEDYARYGVGLYKVTSTATLSSGASCSGSALVKVSGSPLGSWAGRAAAAGVGLGVAGLALGAGLAYSKAPEPSSPFYPTEAELRQQAVAVRDHLSSTRCFGLVLPALLLTILAMVTGGGAAVPPTAGPPRRRTLPRGGIRLSAVGLLSGVLAGASAVVLLQQYAVVYPSTGVIAAGLAAGLAVGILLPSLGWTLGIRRAGRRPKEEPPAQRQSKP